MLEKNYRIVCASSVPPIALPEDFDIKDVVVEILTKHEMEEKRARNMDVDDFLRYVRSHGSWVAHMAHWSLTWLIGRSHGSWVAH